MSQKLRLVCPECRTVNQFPIERLAEKPLCAECKQPLFNGKPVNADNELLKRHIRHSGVPVLVDFWAPWCGPCQAFAPTFEAFAEQAGNQMRLIKVDTQVHQDAAADYNIRSIPTLALFRNGQEINRLSGALGLRELQQWVVQQLTDDH